MLVEELVLAGELGLNGEPVLAAFCCLASSYTWSMISCLIRVMIAAACSLNHRTTWTSNTLGLGPRATKISSPLLKGNYTTECTIVRANPCPRLSALHTVRVYHCLIALHTLHAYHRLNAPHTVRAFLRTQP